MRLLAVLFLLAACSSPRDELAALADKDAPCESDGDCCVVTDGCMATAYVVGEPDFEDARRLAREAEESDTCVGCISPATDVRCHPVRKRCEGREIQRDETPAGLDEDHCGAIVTDPWPDEPGSVTLGCGAG